MIQVHHLNNSRSQRILWLLEELGLAYEIIGYQRDPVTNLAPPELKKIHPLGKSPVVVDDGRVVFESGAIVEYLIQAHGAGRLAPAFGSDDWVTYVQWLHFAEGSAMLPLMLGLYCSRIGEAAAPVLPRIKSEVANHLGYLDGALGGRDFLVGTDLTGADVQMSFVLEAARGHLAHFPNLVRYLGSLQARPAYRRAIERGGPYDLVMKPRPTA
ncbi:MAG TPA: glutathione S-transferase [Aliidongia sp.]|uniref:glutathione S-transferase family protein n=1 Tax=Aliidongia sp. TaxID=1914230 RepID=UPI002DDD6EA9|nr:glutathione S-transferase [Aliidongia sp.]HEV2678594.1 glutathione S-transferase [Aliidongia sp.]